jgi:serine/threonine-protein kinase
MQIGDVIEGKYELLRLLGIGGMGSVYEARHLRIGRRLALKTLHAELAKNTQVVERFLREAQAAAAIGSEHIVDITDAGETAEGVPFLVMEYLEGQDLAHIIQEQAPLDTAWAADVALQLCQGLGAAHERGIVHRDLKPGNVFVVPRPSGPPRVKVLDFGIAKFRDALAREIPELTASGVVMGTPFYMAPEQARGARDVDHRADVYATGVILFEMLSGQRPFQGANYNELIVRVATTEPASLLGLRPGLDGGAAAVVRKAMERERERRFQSMWELAAALEPLAGRTPGAAVRVAARAADPELGTAPTQTPIDAGPARARVPATMPSTAQPRALPKTVPGGGGRRSAWVAVLAVCGALVLGGGGLAAYLAATRGDAPADDGRTAAPLHVSAPGPARVDAAPAATQADAAAAPLGPEPARRPATLDLADAPFAAQRNASKLGDACFNHWKAARYDAGRAACYQALEFAESDRVRGALYYNLCLIEQAEARLDGARWYCRKSLEVRPDNEIVTRRLEALGP